MYVSVIIKKDCHFKTKKCISMTAFNTHTYSVYMPRKRTCTFRLLSLNFQGKYLTFRVQKLIKNGKFPPPENDGDADEDSMMNETANMKTMEMGTIS